MIKWAKSYIALLCLIPDEFTHQEESTLMVNKSIYLSLVLSGAYL